jgi:hypothetical protein
MLEPSGCQSSAEIDQELDAYANSRAADTPVIVFEPRDAAIVQTT